MTGCSSCPGVMLSVQMSLLMQVTPLVLGSCSLLLRRLLSLTLTGSLVALSLNEAGVLLRYVSFVWVVLRFVRRGRMPLMHMRVGLCSCIVTLLLLPCLIFGVGIRPSWRC